MGYGRPRSQVRKCLAATAARGTASRLQVGKGNRLDATAVVIRKVGDRVDRQGTNREWKSRVAVNREGMTQVGVYRKGMTQLGVGRKGVTQAGVGVEEGSPALRGVDSESDDGQLLGMYPTIHTLPRKL